MNALAPIIVDPLAGPSYRESDDDYACIVTRLGDGGRVIVCRDDLQWILQRRDGKRAGRARWASVGYCTTREGLSLLCERAILQVGQFYVGGPGQFCIGANRARTASASRTEIPSMSLAPRFIDVAPGNEPGPGQTFQARTVTAPRLPVFNWFAMAGCIGLGVNEFSHSLSSNRRRSGSG